MMNQSQERESVSFFLRERNVFVGKGLCIFPCEGGGTFFGDCKELIWGACIIYSRAPINWDPML